MKLLCFLSLRVSFLKNKYQNPIKIIGLHILHPAFVNVSFSREIETFGGLWRLSMENIFNNEISREAYQEMLMAKSEVLQGAEFIGRDSEEDKMIGQGYYRLGCSQSRCRNRHPVVTGRLARHYWLDAHPHIEFG